MSRFTEFAAPELALMRGAIMRLVEDLLEQARRDRVPPENAIDAACTVLAGGRLAFEIDDQLGEEHPSLDIFELTAVMIADGTYAAHMAKLFPDEGQTVAGAIAQLRAEAEAA